MAPAVQGTGVAIAGAYVLVSKRLSVQSVPRERNTKKVNLCDRLTVYRLRFYLLNRSLGSAQARGKHQSTGCQHWA